MAFIPVMNVLKCVVRMSYPGRVYTNTLWFQKSGGWSAAGGILMCNTVREWWVDAILPLQSNAVSLLDVLGYDMSDSAGFVVSSGTAGPTAGGYVGAVLPGNVTLAISLRTDNRGKSGRGRLYHIGLPEGQVTNNTVDAGHVSDLDQGYVDFWTAVESESGADWGVVSFQKDGVVRNPGVFQPITQILVNNHVDSQSRRVKE